MVASKELQAGEEIVTEMPFVVGPKACTYPLCLACYTLWPPASDDKPLCSRCGWPVCGEECENSPQHKDYECQVSVTVEWNVRKLFYLKKKWRYVTSKNIIGALLIAID